MRRIREWFVIDFRKPAQHLDGVVRRHIKFCMFRSKMLRHGAGVVRFVALRVTEPDGEGADGGAALSLHQRDNQRGIDPAGEESAQGHVGMHAQLHRIAKKPIQLHTRVLH